MKGSDDFYETEIDNQVELAIDEADIIIFLVDVSSGITSMDYDISELLRKTKKKVFLVVNKVDNSAIINDTNEFYSLGIEKIYPISSASGFGTGDLLDDISKFLIDKSLRRIIKFQDSQLWVDQMLENHPLLILLLGKKEILLLKKREQLGIQ